MEENGPVTDSANLYWREIMLEVIHGSPVGYLRTGLGSNYTGERRLPVLDVLHMLLEP